MALESGQIDVVRWTHGHVGVLLSLLRKPKTDVSFCTRTLNIGKRKFTLLFDIACTATTWQYALRISRYTFHFVVCVVMYHLNVNPCLFYSLKPLINFGLPAWFNFQHMMNSPVD